MLYAGRLYANRRQDGRIEVRRLITKNPVRYGAALAILNPGEPWPAKLQEMEPKDWPHICRQCSGSGYFPNVSEHCPVCQGSGRREEVPMQKPRFRPNPAWEASPYRQLFPNLGR